MSSPSWIQALKSLSRKQPTEADFSALGDEVKSGKSDGGTALLTSALVELGLKSIMALRLVPLSKAEVESLFGRDAPLSTFSGLIRIAYAFGIVDSEVRRDMDRIREIRNVFAHAIIPVTFDAPEISAACDGFVSYKHYCRPAPNIPGTAKVKYKFATGHLLKMFGGVLQHRDSIRWPVRYHSLDG